MKRFLFAVLLILLVSTPAFAMKNEPGGFGGIKWGDKLSQHPDLKPSEGGIGYTRPNDRLQIQLSDVIKVSYFFDEQEGFFMVFVFFQFFTDIEQILLECSELWGEHDAITVEKNDDNSVDIYIKWKGQQTTAELHTNSAANLSLLSIHDDDRWQRRKYRNEQR